MTPTDSIYEPFSRKDFIVAAVAGNAFPEIVIHQLLAPLAKSIHREVLAGTSITLHDDEPQ